jgi:hypothetical protein
LFRGSFEDRHLPASLASHDASRLTSPDPGPGTGHCRGENRPAMPRAGNRVASRRRLQDTQIAISHCPPAFPLNAIEKSPPGHIPFSLTRSTQIAVVDETLMEGEGGFRPVFVHPANAHMSHEPQREMNEERIKRALRDSGLESLPVPT